MNKQLQIQHHVEGMLDATGVTSDVHLEGTPERVARAFVECYLSGYQSDPKKILSTQFHEGDYDDVVLVKDIRFYSMCAHHLLPFFGRVACAYVPDGSVVGLALIGEMEI